MNTESKININTYFIMRYNDLDNETWNNFKITLFKIISKKSKDKINVETIPETTQIIEISSETFTIKFYTIKTYKSSDNITQQIHISNNAINCEYIMDTIKETKINYMHSPCTIKTFYVYDDNTGAINDIKKILHCVYENFEKKINLVICKDTGNIMEIKTDTIHFKFYNLNNIELPNEVKNKIIINGDTTTLNNPILQVFDSFKTINFVTGPDLSHIL